MTTPDVLVIKDLRSTNHKRPTSISSNIPTLRGRVPSATGSPNKSPQKLRLQSPQKLRERFPNEAKAINEASASLQSELSLIGAEMAKLSSSPPTLTITTSNSSSSASSSSQATLTHLQTTLTSLEARIPTLTQTLTHNHSLLKTDLEKSLAATEFKLKGLDQLYKESSAENELLYEKFNAELGKIVKALKGKGEKEEWVAKLKESSEETARVKKENARLRREVLSLRTVVKGHE